MYGVRQESFARMVQWRIRSFILLSDLWKTRHAPSFLWGEGRHLRQSICVPDNEPGSVSRSPALVIIRSQGHRTARANVLSKLAQRVDLDEAIAPFKGRYRFRVRII